MSVALREEKDIREIISELSVEEKAKFLIAATACISQSVPEREIEPLVLADGATGVNGVHILLDFFAEAAKMAMSGVEGKPVGKGQGNPLFELQELIGMEEEEAYGAAKGNPMKGSFLDYLKERRNPEGRFISFPSGINIGACFSEEQAYRIGEAVGKEMRAARIDVCLGPNVDIMRDPLGGRNYEMYGEDPVLVGRTAAAFIRGMQSTGTAACAKHFIANNQETRRQSKDTHVSERTLRELYARGFKKAVKDGGVRVVMSAYNAVNGTFSSYNRTILTDWLKEEWGFDGVVVSDWGAVTGHNDAAVDAGMDLVLHGPSPCDETDIVKAVKEGTLSEERVNDAVERILKLTLWLRKQRLCAAPDYPQEDLLRQAYETVTEGMVLLKNEGALPLSKESCVAFYGKRARETMECGSGSTYIITPLHSNVSGESEKMCAAVEFEQMEGADTVVYAAGAEGGENADRPSMDLDREDAERIGQILREAKEKGKKTVVLLNVAGPVDMRSWLDYADAVLVLFVPGCMGGKAAADVLFGKAVPGGRLPVTFPVKLEDTPAYPYPVGEHDDVYYSEGVFVGYRWYESKKVPTQYPFGYGLSYTEFEQTAEELPKEWDVERTDALNVSVRVRNTGKREGRQVIQLYMGRENPNLSMPVKELMAYVKVTLAPREEKTAILTINREDLEVFDPERGSIIPVGNCRLFLGTDSERIFAEAELEIKGKNPYCLGEHSTLGEILDNPDAADVIEKYVPGAMNIPEEYKKLLGNEPIGPLLSRQLIGSIPDANELQAFLNRLFAELAEI